MKFRSTLTLPAAFLVAAAALAFGLAAAASAQKPQHVSLAAAPAGLTTAQIAALFPGRQIWFINSYGHKVYALFGHGTVSAVTTGADPPRDTGVWHAQKNKLCITWLSWHDNVENCYGVGSLGGGQYVWEGGSNNGISFVLR